MREPRQSNTDDDKSGYLEEPTPRCKTKRRLKQFSGSNFGTLQEVAQTRGFWDRAPHMSSRHRLWDLRQTIPAALDNRAIVFVEGHRGGAAVGIGGLGHVAAIAVWCPPAFSDRSTDALLVVQQHWTANTVSAGGGRDAAAAAGEDEQPERHAAE